MLLLWSGGVDSTLLLYDLLRIGGNDVRTISVQHPQVAAVEESSNARDEIMHHFEKQGLTFQRTEVKINQEIKSIVKGEWAIQGAEGGNGLTQPSVWIAECIPYLKPAENLYAGYIKGDDVWHYWRELSQGFDFLQYTRGGTGKLMAPLEWSDKTECVRRINELGLLRKVWYCEDPQHSKSCRNCHSCRKHNIAEVMLGLKKQIYPAKSIRVEATA